MGEDEFLNEKPSLERRLTCTTFVVLLDITRSYDGDGTSTVGMVIVTTSEILSSSSSSEQELSHAFSRGLVHVTFSTVRFWRFYSYIPPATVK